MTVKELIKALRKYNKKSKIVVDISFQNGEKAAANISRIIADYESNTIQLCFDQDIIIPNNYGRLILDSEEIKRRQREGIQKAKERGVYKGRKPIERENFTEVVTVWRRGEITAVEAMRQLDMKPSTFYRKVKLLDGC